MRPMDLKKLIQCGPPMAAHWQGLAGVNNIKQHDAKIGRTRTEKPHVSR